MAARRRRTKTAKVPVQLLNADLAELAKLRKTKWAWDGSMYSKSKRSCGPDREGLKLYYSPLMKILHHCRNGFPCHRGLTDVFTWLEETYNVLGDVQPTVVADIYRIMCRHVVELARCKTDGGMYINDLTNLIVDEPDAALDDIPRDQDGFPIFESELETEIDASDGDVIDGDVTITAAVCRCSDCTGVLEIEADAEMQEFQDEVLDVDMPIYLHVDIPQEKMQCQLRT